MLIRIAKKIKQKATIDYLEMNVQTLLKHVHELKYKSLDCEKKMIDWIV